MKRLLLALTAAAIAPATFSEQTLCDYHGSGSHWIIGRKQGGAFEIRIDNPVRVREVLSHWSESQAYSARNSLPAGENSYEATEFLAQEAAAVILYANRPPLDAATAAPLPLDGVWRGPEPLSCLRSFAQAANLEVIVPQPGLWLIGSPEWVRQAAVLAFAYSMDADLQSLRDQTAVRDLELAFLRRLPIRAFEPPIQRDDKTWNLSPALVGLGYYAVPGEPDTYLVVASHGAFTNPTLGPEELTALAAKLRVRRDGGKVTAECVWARFVPGPLVPGVQEDIDGDGLQDFYFQPAEDSQTTGLIVAGADGWGIAAVSADSIAVEKNTSGPKRFSVIAVRQDESGPAHEPRALVYRLNPKTKQLEVVPARGSSTGESPEQETVPARSYYSPAELLGCELGSTEKVRVYWLPGRRAPCTPGMEFIQLHGSPVWGWFLNRNPREAIEQIPPNLQMHVLFRYLSPGYLEGRKKGLTSRQP